jgi:hypothetical protein
MQHPAAKNIMFLYLVLAAGGSVAKWPETSTAVVSGTSAVYSSTTAKGSSRWTQKRHFSTAAINSGTDGKRRCYKSVFIMSGFVPYTKIHHTSLLLHSADCGPSS